MPDLADWCIIDLIENEVPERVALVHGDASSRELVTDHMKVNAGELAGQLRTSDVIRTRTPQLLADITEEMLVAGAQSTGHLQLLRALAPCSWIGVPLVARGQVLGMIHLVMSDSRRHYTPADLEVATELGQRTGVAVDNARLYRDTQQAVRIRDDVLAIVSHDLRNPLGAIDLASTFLLQLRSTDARERKHLEVIRRAAGRMDHLINDLLDMASINVRQFSIKPTLVDAGDVLDEAVELHDPVAQERGITIVCQSTLHGVSLRADRDRLLQVFGNLLGNALKFCSPGDVITVRGETVDGRVRFTIADTGPGIPSGELLHIFEPYWSGHTGKKKGTGLGLFITKAIVEAHHGTIEATSDEGKGATFVIALPIATAPGAVSSASAS